jgi:hypothetical protein
LIFYYSKINKYKMFKIFHCEDVFKYLFKFVHKDNIISLKLVCKQIYNLILDSNLWKFLIDRDYSVEHLLYQECIEKINKKSIDSMKSIRDVKDLLYPFENFPQQLSEEDRRQSEHVIYRYKFIIENLQKDVLSEPLKSLYFTDPIKLYIQLFKKNKNYI